MRAFPLIVPGIRLDRDASREAALALERARTPWVAGFLLFGGEAREVEDLTARLRDAAARPIFVAADLERGAGQQVRGLTVLPDAGLWGFAATPDEVETYGRLTAAEALSVGIDVVFAPVLDVRSELHNPIVGNRAFSFDPDRVTRLGAAFARGVLDAGAVPVAKHYPGHGATSADSHDAVPVVREGRRRLEARDLAPFHALLAEGLAPGVMTAHVAYPALDASQAIATFSRPILDGLRAACPDPDDVAVFTDALLMEGARAGIGEVEAGRRALLAGCDLLLYPDDPEALAAGLLTGAPPPLGAAAEKALGRTRALLGRLRVLGAAARAPAPDSGEVPERVARRALDLAGVEGPERDWVLVLDDDDVPGRGAVLAEAGRAAGVPVAIYRLPRGERPPEEGPVSGGATVVVMSSIRAWKGTPGASPLCAALVGDLADRARAAGRRLCVLSLGPRSEGGSAHVPGTGPAVERALAARLFAAR